MPPAWGCQLQFTTAIFTASARGKGSLEALKPRFGARLKGASTLVDIEVPDTGEAGLGQEQQNRILLRCTHDWRLPGPRFRATRVKKPTFQLFQSFLQLRSQCAETCMGSLDLGSAKETSSGHRLSRAKPFSIHTVVGSVLTGTRVVSLLDLCACLAKNEISWWHARAASIICEMEGSQEFELT